MRLSTFLAGAGVLFAFGFLGFRILDLEQRVAVLAERGAQQASAGPTQPPTAARPNANAPPNQYGARLDAIERRIAKLEKTSHGLSLPTSNLGEDRLKQEQAILSVVERENSRIRDVQLEWHRARWLETRKQQLAGFAYSQKLEPAQTAQLYNAIEHELDGMVDVMKRPSFAEDPDQVASDWQAILAETDNRAQEILSPAQYQTWWQGRLFERKVLWPWLPDKPEQTAQR